MSIQDLIDQALVQEPHEGAGKITASGLGMCFRQQFWRRSNEPQSNPPDKRQLRVFHAGDLFHDFVQGLLVKQGYQKEVPYEDDDIKLRADLVSDNEVGDIKSQHSKSFWWMKKELDMGKTIQEIKYNNFLQVMLGCRVFKKPFGRLIFVSKDDLVIAEYVDKYENWQNEVEKELQILRDIWKLGKLPPAVPRCEPNKKGEYWHCTFCNWKDKCDKLEGKKK